MRDYGKVHTRFWSSETARSMSDDGRMLALYLITSPHSTIAGVFPLPDGYICEDMQWDAERVKKGFAELSRNGFADRCETTKWVWVREHLKWNPPENPNQRKSAAKVASTIPDKCAWKKEFLLLIGPSLGIELANPSPTVAQPFLNQEQSKQEQKQEGSAKSSRQTRMPEGFGISDRVRQWAKEKGFTAYDLDANLAAFLSYVKRKGAKYVDWDEALMTAVRDNWAKTARGSPETAGSAAWAGAK